MHNHQTRPQTPARDSSLRCLLALLIGLVCPVAAMAAPTAVFSPVSIRLDAGGNYTLSATDIDAISAGSSGNGFAITNRAVIPASFNFCDVGSKPVTLTVTDANGNSASQPGNLTIRAPANPPVIVYVSAAYGTSCWAVSFPGIAGTYYVGYNSFNSIQSAVDAVANGGTVQVAAGVYAENVTIAKSVSMLGPNAGKSGMDATRGAEAVILPANNDPENTPIISVVTNYVSLDGLLLDGNNPALGTGYQGNGAQLYAAAGVQNGVYPNLSNVSNLTIRNNIIRNVSYDGIYLDRFDFIDTASTGNFILANKFENTWEGILTYAVHSVIANNTITNVNRGLSLHGTITDAGGFIPAITNNQLTIAQWWPTEITRLRAVGIWINYRREHAAPLWVADNVVETPVAAPQNATIRGLEALTVDGQGSVTFARNIVNGFNNCYAGFYASACWSNNAVRVLGGSLNDVQVGVLATTADPDYGPGNVYVTLSNVTIHAAEGGTGVLALQDPTTPTSSAGVNVLANSSISGGAIGVSLQGTRSSAVILNNVASITGNGYGVDVSDGKALLENNNLTGNLKAAIRVEGSGMVDAGDCSGSNVTGLGTGSGGNGSSSGGNVLSGYGFDAKSPWAVQNDGTGIVKAEQNEFGARPGYTIARVISGAVDYSQGGDAFVACPSPICVRTIDEIPPAATTLADFIAAGGIASSKAGTLTHSNYPSVLVPGNQTVYRTYCLTDPCGQVAFSTQEIKVVVDRPTMKLMSYSSSAHQPTLSVTGATGLRFAIRATTNFVDWEMLVTNTVPYDFTDVNALAIGARFYQCVWLP